MCYWFFWAYYPTCNCSVIGPLLTHLFLRTLCCNRSLSILHASLILRKWKYLKDTNVAMLLAANLLFLQVFLCLSLLRKICVTSSSVTDLVWPLGGKKKSFFVFVFSCCFAFFFVFLCVCFFFFQSYLSIWLHMKI